MEKLIITAAICGAEVTKQHNSAVPYTVEEMVREAKSAFEAGAAVIHLIKIFILIALMCMLVVILV